MVGGSIFGECLLILFLLLFQIVLLFRIRRKIRKAGIDRSVSCLPRGKKFETATRPAARPFFFFFLRICMHERFLACVDYTEICATARSSKIVQCLALFTNSSLFLSHSQAWPRTICARTGQKQIEAHMYVYHHETRRALLVLLSGGDRCEKMKTCKSQPPRPCLSGMKRPRPMSQSWDTRQDKTGTRTRLRHDMMIMLG